MRGRSLFGVRLLLVLLAALLVTEIVGVGLNKIAESYIPPGAKKDANPEVIKLAEKGAEEEAEITKKQNEEIGKSEGIVGEGVAEATRQQDPKSKGDQSKGQKTVSDEELHANLDKQYKAATKGQIGKEKLSKKELEEIERMLVDNFNNDNRVEGRRKGTNRGEEEESRRQRRDADRANRENAARQKEAQEKEAAARREAEEKARKEAQDKKEAEELARKQEEERKRIEAETKARQEAEEKARREAEERAKKEAEEKAKREAEERVKKEAEERARKEAEEQQKREQEEKARLEEEERIRKQREEEVKREEEKARKEQERIAKQAEEARLAVEKAEKERLEKLEAEKAAIEDAKRKQEAEENQRRLEEERIIQEEAEKARAQTASSDDIDLQPPELKHFDSKDIADIIDTEDFSFDNKPSRGEEIRVVDDLKPDRYLGTIWERLAPSNQPLSGITDISYSSLLIALLSSKHLFAIILILVTLRWTILGMIFVSKLVNDGEIDSARVARFFKIIGGELDNGTHVLRNFAHKHGYATAEVSASTHGKALAGRDFSQLSKSMDQLLASAKKNLQEMSK